MKIKIDKWYGKKRLILVFRNNFLKGFYLGLGAIIGIFLILFLASIPTILALAFDTPWFLLLYVFLISALLGVLEYVDEEWVPTIYEVEKESKE